MSDLPRELIQEAINCLSLNDIVLFSARFERGDLKAPVDEGTQQYKQQVNHNLCRRDGSKGSPDLLQVMVTLGTRVVAGAGDESDGPEIFRIEADFLAEYEVTRCPSEDAAKAFAEYNAVHNVWPFWRQHVFDVVQRGRLPQLDIPLTRAVTP
jgi:preprotein translocase subunit SecB